MPILRLAIFEFKFKKNKIDALVVVFPNLDCGMQPKSRRDCLTVYPIIMRNTLLILLP